MRILFLLTQDLESPSGLGRYWPLARQLSRLEQQISVAALHPDFANLCEKQSMIEGVSVNYVAPMHVIKSGSEKKYYKSGKLFHITAQAAWQLGKTSLLTPADLIHIGKPHPMNSLAAMAGRFFHGRHIYVDCDDFEAASGRFSSGWQKTTVAGFEKWTPRHARAVTTNTFFMRNQLISWGTLPEQILYLPNGIDRERFSKNNIDQAARLRSELGLEHKHVVIYIGSLSLPSHPVNLLLESFSEMLNSHANAVLLLVGGGEDQLTLKNLAQRLGIDPSVRFIGRVAPDQVPDYYRLADVSVDPVHDDDAARGRCPLKLFESWACGVPFVTADVGDRRILLGNPPAGLLSQPGDPVSLASAITQVLRQPELATTLIQSGKKRVENYYWDILAQNLLDFYLTHELRPS